MTFPCYVPAMDDRESPVTRSEAVTEDLRVEVKARFSATRSNPTTGRWFFLYTIRVSNEGSQTVQLLSRHWMISDGTGRTEEVRGDGVVSGPTDPVVESPLQLLAHFVDGRHP